MWVEQVFLTAARSVERHEADIVTEHLTALTACRRPAAALTSGLF